MSTENQGAFGRRRRDLLKLVACGAVAAALSAVPGIGVAGRRWPIGLQLFTVMAELERDIDGLLGTIAAIGYQEVETIGTFGRDAAQLRALLDRHGLRSPSQHLMPANLYPNFLAFTRKEISTDAVRDAWATEMSMARLQDNVRQAIGWAHALGQQFVVLQMIWPEQMSDRKLLQQVADALNAAGKLCADSGLTFCFHNHAEEFKARDGFVPYDWLLEHTDPKLVKLELDIYWAVHGGRDPIELLRKHKGRFLQCHVKDSDAKGDFATVGKGVIDLARILPACWDSGVRHYYVEYDRADDPMQVVRDAYGYLAGLPE